MTEKLPIFFLHGWNGSENTFIRVAKLLDRKEFEAKALHLGEYDTSDDNLSIDDFAIALEKAVQNETDNLENARPQFDLVVYSTGALVARTWLTRFYKVTERSPVRKLIMVAPGNNGSRIAHWGKKIPFDWGNKVLTAMELASQHTWDLNWKWLDQQHHDNMEGLELYLMLASHNDFTFPGFLDDFDDAAKIDFPVVEEDGSDTTIRFCAGNLNMKGIRINAGKTVPESTIQEIRDIPIYHFKDRSHSGEKHGILDAIRDDDEDDSVFTKLLEILNRSPEEAPPGLYDPVTGHNFAMIVLRVVDEAGNPFMECLPHFFFNSIDESAQDKPIEIEHHFQNDANNCYYLRFNDGLNIRHFGFQIHEKTVGQARYQESQRIELINVDTGIDFLERGKTHFIELQVAKTLQESAFRFRTLDEVP